MLELNPAAQEEVDRGIKEDGSNLSGVSARCSWATADIDALVLENNDVHRDVEGEGGCLREGPVMFHSDAEQIKAAFRKGSLNPRPVLPPIKSHLQQQ